MTARPEQKDVIVVSAEKRLDCDQAIAARPILDDDRLAAPAGRQPLCHEPRPDARTSSGPEWHEKLTAHTCDFAVCATHTVDKGELSKERQQISREQRTERGWTLASRSSDVAPRLSDLRSSLMHARCCPFRRRVPATLRH